MATHACTQCSGDTDTGNHPQTIAGSVARSHSSHSETRCSNGHATTQIRNRNTAAQHSSRCARDSCSNARPRHSLYIVSMLHSARMTPQPRLSHFRSPNTPHTTHTRARRYTRCDKPHPPQRHVSVMARVTQSSARQQATHRTSHTHTQHTNTQAPHARRTTRTAATTAHCANITARTVARTQHTTRHTAPRTPHTAHRKTHPVTRPPRHTHVRAVRLPSVDGMLPDSWLKCNHNTLQDTRTAIASHHGTRRRCRTHPADRSASQLINQIKSNESQSAHCMLSLKNSNLCQ